MAKWTGTLPLYKGSGAAKFSLMRPKYGEPDQNGNQRVAKNGAILLEVAKGVGKQDWDWSRKISFAIGIPDICKLFDNPDAPPKLVHKKEDQDVSKSLQLLPGEGKYAGTWRLMVSQYGNEGRWPQDTESMSIMVPLTPGEFIVVQKLLIDAVPELLAWTNQG